MNVASKMAAKRYPQYDCLIFHDVDMIPEDARNLYRCGRFPRHLSPAVDEFNYTYCTLSYHEYCNVKSTFLEFSSLPYPTIVGGVFAINQQQFRLVNGFSNMYWGWGKVYKKIFFFRNIICKWVIMLEIIFLGAEDDDMYYR